MKNKMKILSVYASKNTHSGYHIKNTMTDPTADPPCLLSPEIDEVKEIYVGYAVGQYRKEFGKFLFKPKTDFDSYKKYENFEEVDALIQQKGKRLSEILQHIETENTSVQCMVDEKVKEFCELIYARVYSLLHAQYWLDIPDGKEKLEEAQAAFERLCANAKLPRRTAFIINSRKKGKI